MMNNYGIQRQTIKKEYKEASWVTAAYCKSSPPLVELNRFLDRKLFRDKIDWPVLLAQLLANVPHATARTYKFAISIHFYIMCKVDAL